MDEATHGVRADQAEKPKHQQNNKDSPQHMRVPFSCSIVLRIRYIARAYRTGKFAKVLFSIFCAGRNYERDLLATSSMTARKFQSLSSNRWRAES